MNYDKCECGAERCNYFAMVKKGQEYGFCNKCGAPVTHSEGHFKKCGNTPGASKCVKHEKHIDDWFAMRYWHESSQDNGYCLDHDDVGYLKNTIRALETKIAAHSLAQPNALPFVDSYTTTGTGPGEQVVAEELPESLLRYAENAKKLGWNLTARALTEAADSIHTLEDKVKELEAAKAICEGKTNDYLDGKLLPGNWSDGTDAACPGWWRGHDSVAPDVMKRLNDAEAKARELERGQLIFGNCCLCKNPITISQSRVWLKDGYAHRSCNDKRCAEVAEAKVKELELKVIQVEFSNDQYQAHAKVAIRQLMEEETKNTELEAKVKELEAQLVAEKEDYRIQERLFQQCSKNEKYFRDENKVLTERVKAAEADNEKLRDYLRAIRQQQSIVKPGSATWNMANKALAGKEKAPNHQLFELQNAVLREQIDHLQAQLAILADGEIMEHFAGVSSGGYFCRDCAAMGTLINMKHLTDCKNPLANFQESAKELLKAQFTQRR